MKRARTRRLLLTEQVVQSLAKAAGTVYDMEVRELAVTTTPEQHRHFYVVVKIGEPGAMTLDRARSIACRALDVVAGTKLLRRPVRRDPEVQEEQMAAE